MKTFLFNNILLLIALYPFSPAIGGVVLSEIMFHPQINGSADEFIELYNDDMFPIDLSSWKIAASGDTDLIVSHQNGLTAGPGEYIVILDSNYFLQSATYDDLIPNQMLVVTIGDAAFGNGGLPDSHDETVSLINPLGQVVSSYTYSIENAAGYSDEKINLRAGDDANNWTNAIILHGTPGARNSVVPPDHDLAITHFSLEPRNPSVGDSIWVSLVVKNVGLVVNSDSLKLTVQNSIADNSAFVLAAWFIQNLASGDSVTKEIGLKRESTWGPLLVAQLLAADERPSNNRRTLSFGNANGTPLIIFSEIMYQPNANRSEWIELYNNVGYEINLENWSFADGAGLSNPARRLSLPSFVFSAGSYAILASDSSVYFESIPPATVVLLWHGKPIALNNSGDSLALFDADSALAERVDYLPSWGGSPSGKSLERISMQELSNDAQNWATSLDSSGSTPGRENSRTDLLLQPNNILVLTPNPFSPDGDSREDILRVQFRLNEADSRLDLKIYDVRGREVRRLANNLSAGLFGEITWDGKDGRGRELPTGLYIVYLEAFGKGDTRLQTAKRVVALARRS